MFFHFVIRRPFLIFALASVLTAAFAVQLGNLRLDPDTESYIPQRHPVRAFWAEAREHFGLGGHLLLAVVAEEDNGVFSPEVLAGVAELTERIQALERVVATGVRSISNSDAIIASEEGMETVAFFEDAPRTRAEAEAVREQLFKNPVYLDRLVSRDGSIAAILVNIDFYRQDHSLIYWDIAEVIEGYEIPGTRLMLAGTPAVEAVFGRQMATDLQRLIPLSLMAVVTVLFLCFPVVTLRNLALRGSIVWLAFALASYLRTAAFEPLTIIPLVVIFTLLPVRGVMLPSLVVVLSVVWTWGLQAMLDVPIYIAGIIMPPILLAIGCADGIHIIERYNENVLLYGEREKAVLETMGEMWRPVVLTSITTAIGFGALTTGQMVADQVLGAFSAFGILVAMAVSLTLIPAMLAVLPLPEEKLLGRRRALSPRILIRLGEFVEKRRVLLCVAGAVVTVVFLASSFMLRIDYSWVESLAPETPVLLADRYLRERHGGTMPLNIIVRSNSEGGIKDPKILRAMEAVLASLAADAEVGDTRSIAEYVKRMNQVMEADRPGTYRIPDSSDLVAQYLLLYSISGDPGELDDMVDYEYRTANMSVLLRSDSMATLSRIMSKTEALLDLHLRGLDGVTATVTGSARMMWVIFSMVLGSQIYSLTVAAVLVLTVMTVLFRSFTDTLMCIVPSSFAAILNFGFMGMLGIPLGPEKAIISAIALGIGIDYAIHLMTRFREVLGRGLSVEEAVVEAMRTVGRAILFNAVVVVAGFAVLGFSSAPSNVIFGGLVALNMATSALGALLLLPALLAVDGHRRAAKGPTKKAPWLRDAA